MISPKSFTESLMFGTLRIEAIDDAGVTKCGTAFFFQAAVGEDRVLHMIVTNRHVVAGAATGKLRFHKALSESDFSPADATYTLTIGGTTASDKFESIWTGHPDPTVDLCATPASGLLKHLREQGHHIYFQSVNDSFILSQDELEGLMAVEDVIMVGYPIGLHDEAHNLPLTRGGITATHPAIDFQKRPEGVVDMACFPGSSGSPIFLYNATTYYDKRTQKSRGGPRQAFLGVLYAGPRQKVNGDIVVKTIPTSAQRVPVSETLVMIHLGYFIKAREVSVLASTLAAKLALAPKTGSV